LVTAKYTDLETLKQVDFYCQEKEALDLASGLCMFHDKDYLQDKTNNEEHKRKVLDRLKHKVNHAISNNEPLLCIGFQLPEFRLSDSQFFGKAEFFEAKFHGEAHFGGATFHEAQFNEAKFRRAVVFCGTDFLGLATFIDSEFFGKTYFSGHFNAKTNFNYVLFEGKEKAIFDVENLSNVSFMDTDLTGIRFSDEARWGGGEKAKEERFKVRDERLLEKNIKENYGHTKDFNLGSIKAVYRNLRENYEYRMRYDETGQFFIREMELKRRYREVVSKEEKEEKVDNNVGVEEEPQAEPKQEEEGGLEIKQNNWFRRNLFSLTGWYYHLSRYGESLWRPTLAGIAIIFLSTLFWSMQENPELKPWLPIFQDDDTGNVTKFVGFDKFGDGDHWLKAYERSIAGFIPLLSFESGIKVGIIDYVIKIVGGAVVFALIAVALRRRFERRYRH
jgi:hypothetical protein